jgi:hypothetical protein
MSIYLLFSPQPQPHKNLSLVLMVAPLIMHTLVEGPMPCQGNIAAPSNVPNWTRQFAPYRGIILYLEYQSVCPFVRSGSPRPRLPQESVSPPWNQRGKDSLAGEGGGGSQFQFGRLERKPGTLSFLLFARIAQKGSSECWGCRTNPRLHFSQIFEFSEKEPDLLKSVFNLLAPYRRKFSNY